MSALKINRRDPMWKEARAAIKDELASVHVTIDDVLADRLARATADALRHYALSVEAGWRESSDTHQRNAERAWELVRRAAPFVNAVLCMTIDRFRAEGKTAPALEWLAEAAILKDEKAEGERIAREILAVRAAAVQPPEEQRR